MDLASGAEITYSRGMSAKNAIFVAISSSSFVLLLPTIISGLIPSPVSYTHLTLPTNREV